MPNWLIKTAVQRTISWLPKRQFWNGLLQKFITGSTTANRGTFEKQLGECERHLRAMRSAGVTAETFCAVEIGTGWLPGVPLGLYLCGADTVWTFDIDPLLEPGRVAAVLEFFSDYDRRGELRKFLPAYRAERVEVLRKLIARAKGESPITVLATLGIHVKVKDAQQTELSPKSVELVFSNGVVEYIPRPVLQGIFKETRRILKPGGVTSHRINMIDQFSYFDRAITEFNFLKYTAKRWSWLNSPLIWQNRLRASDYRVLLTEAGFEVVMEDKVLGKAEDLARVKLAPEFRHYRQEDLLVLHLFIAGRLPAND